jgi:adenylate kinase family enzyme
MKQIHTMLLISGTCASGKTTVGQILSQQYGFSHVDGDVVKQDLEAKRKEKVAWNTIHGDIIERSVALFDHSSVVITHVVLPKILPQYELACRERDIPLQIVILMPERKEIYKRNATRTCWSRPTPQKFIDEFHDAYLREKEQLEQYFFDSTGQTGEESAKEILKVRT